MKLTKKNKGFTLVELIVVIVIIGVLAAVLVPSLTSYIRKAKINANYQEACTICGYLDSACAEGYEFEHDILGTVVATKYADFAECDMKDFYKAYAGKDFPSTAALSVKIDESVPYLYYTNRNIQIKVSLLTRDMSEVVKK